jgi:G3E family GTPase
MVSIPLHLINGFLGSGKTTFLMNYLNRFGKEKKIAVIQNEFSPLGIDGLTLKQHKGLYRMLEVNNGSVFCVCLLGSFIESLAGFIEDHTPDEIVMEASGMSDPVSIAQILQSARLRGKVYLGHTWTVVDARNYWRVTAIRSRLDHQIRIADTVIINKCDQAEEVEKTLDAVSRINPFAVIHRTVFAKISFDIRRNKSRLFPALETSESCRSDLQSVVIRSNRMIPMEKLVTFIESVRQGFIRCKGYVNTGTREKTLVQGVYDDYTFSSVEWFAGVTELVGIGLLDDETNYTATFEHFCE